MLSVLDQSHTDDVGQCEGRSTRSVDSGLECLLLIAALHGVAADPHELRHEFGHEQFSAFTILLAARKLGLTAKLMTVKPARLDRAALPAVAVDHEGSFFVLAKLDQSNASRARVLIQRPSMPPQVLPLAKFLSLWSGRLLFFT